LENDKNTYTTLEYTNEEQELINTLKQQQQEGEEEGEKSLDIPFQKEDILKEKPLLQEIYSELVLLEGENNTITARTKIIVNSVCANFLKHINYQEK